MTRPAGAPQHAPRAGTGFGAAGAENGGHPGRFAASDGLLRAGRVRGFAQFHRIVFKFCQDFQTFTRRRILYTAGGLGV